MATGFVDSDPQESNASQHDLQEQRSSWDHPNDSLSLELSSPHDEPRSRREMLHTLADRYYAEKRRADDAERMLQDLVIRMKTINEARLQALHDAAKANEELKLYKIQLRTAQNEIYKAQDTIEAVDRQRYNAEKEAAKFRSKTRRLNEDILMLAAREEAWKLGLQEGLNRGRSNEEDRYVEYAEEAEEGALDDVDSYDETISSNDSNAFPARPPSIQDRPPSENHPSPSLVPLQLPPSSPAVVNSVHTSENIRPLSIRSGYTRPSSTQQATPSPTPAPLPGNRPPSSLSVRPPENVRPVSIRSGYTRLSSRQNETPFSSQAPLPGHQPPSSQSVRSVSVRNEYTRPSSTQGATPSLTPAPLPGNRPPSSQSIRPSENVRPASVQSGYTRPSSRQHATPSSTQVPLPGNQPPPPQSVHTSENVRPVSIRSGHTRPSSRQHASPSPVPVPSTSNTRPSSPYRPLPPDNFIPSLDADNKIRIPPPFEFQRAAMTPERPFSPQLPTTAMSDSSQEAVMIPGPHAKAPQQHRNRYHRRHSSSESNSSSLSALDIINDRPPMGIGTPMSIIPEVASVQSSAIQLPDGDHHSRRQRSFGDNSMHALNLDNSQHIEAPISHLRPHSRSSYAGSPRNAQLQAETRSGVSYDSSPPNITVQPSSRRTSMAQSGSTNALAKVLETRDPSMLVPGGYPPVVDQIYDDSGASASMEPDWSGAAASAAHVPLLPSNSLTGPVPSSLNSLNVDAIMDSRKKMGKGKKREQ